ncbi:protein cordon-bleu isoform X2 [Trichomycterus rosablanca]
MKTRAPPPPSAPQPAPRKIFRNALPDGGVLDANENIPQSVLDLHLTLPNGYQTLVTVDGRRALMDVLVDLCAQYHLNPADHTLDLASADGQPVPYKPSTIVGTLDISRVLVKERVWEERAPRRPAPKVPEKTVRLVVNYSRGQKAVVRVSPLVPLQTLVPTICQKCDFDPARVLLLRDAVSQHELDPHKSVAELNIRELYVLDQRLALRPKTVSAPVLNHSVDSVRSDAPSASGGEKKGFLGLFKFNRGKSKGPSTVSGVYVEARPNTLGQSQSAMNLSRVSPKIEPKKRRAPAAPPVQIETQASQTQIQYDPAQAPQTKPASPKLDNQLKKRKAPAPPPSTAPSTPSSIPAMPIVRVLSATVPTDDSMSDLSHSIEDSEPTPSICSSSSSDYAAESSSLAEEPMPRPAAFELEPELEIEPEPKIKPEPKLVILKAAPLPEAVPEPPPQPVPRTVVKREPEETESALELKMDEVENNRHSAIGWLSLAEQEAETVSMCSSESFADQGYAASEGMADSPSASPEDTVSLCPDPSPSPSQPQEDSDDDEGCATWGSRYSTRDVRGEHQSVKRWNGYGDTEITAQIHLTLADLDADLVHAADQSEVASVRMKDDIPVSVVDLDIPVTSIDDVLDDDRSSMSAYEVALLRSNIKKQDSSNKITVDLQNKNNNATRVAHVQVGQYQTLDSSKKAENIATGPWIKSESQTERLKSPEMSQNPVVSSVSRALPDSKILPSKLLPEVERTAYAKGPTPYQSKITQNPMSRFGLKTFTIVPPKPAVSQTPKPVGSLRTGAIKIDEFGNMVKQTEVRDRSGLPDGVNNDLDSPLLGKAKAFWNSAQKQDLPPLTNTRASVKTREPGFLKSEIPVTATSLAKSSLQQPKQVSGSVTNLSSVRTREAEIPHSEMPVKMISREKEKSNIQEPLKQFGGSTPNLASAVIKKLAVADPAESMFFSEHRKNFLVPSRRTSSQYVASAIAKYAGNTSTKGGVQELPESTGSQKQVTNQGVSLAVSATSVPKTTSTVQQQLTNQAIKPAISNHKNLPAPTNVSYNAGPKRSQSYISYIAEKVEVLEEPQFTGTTTKTLNSSLRNNNTQVFMYPKPTQHPPKNSTTANKVPKNASPPQSPTNTHLSVPKKPEVSIQVAPSEPNQIGLFGPVKKFKPVIPKTVEKETSLHSSLMKAIQSGGGTERLRKVSDSSRSSTLTKPTYVEAENERSALLSAIRAHHSTRLKKTRSGAAAELDKCRKAEEDRAVEKDMTFIPPPDPPAFAPPPPPPPAFVPPPPTPARVLPAGGNPELVREALLEAIRTGSGAKQLRKVPVSRKTVKVNGRLGIIQAPSPHPQEQ